MRLKLTYHAAKAGGVREIISELSFSLKLKHHAAEAGGVYIFYSFVTDGPDADRCMNNRSPLLDSVGIVSG
jgi:hypothetical protein